MKRFLYTGILISTLLLAELLGKGQNSNKQFEFDDFFKYNTFSSVAFRGLRSMKNGENYIVSEAQGTKLVVYSYEKGLAIKTLLDLSTFNIPTLKTFSDFILTTNETKILLVTDKQPIYRRSFTANYYVYDTNKNTIEILSENGPQQVATFSPDGNKIAFIRNNNIFIVDLNTKKEKQVTIDGKFNSVINGVPDWVYEEEFGINKALEWSPDGKYLAWVRFDESEVPLFSMSMFQGMEPSINANKLYPGITTFKYPKAGEPNSVVSVHTYSLETGKTQNMDIGSDIDIYIPRIRFTKDPGKLAIFKLNRLQNKYEILLADPLSGKTQLLLTDSQKYYFEKDYADRIIFMEDKKHFTLMSDQDGYSHIYIYNMQGKQVFQVTKGNFDVKELNGCDEKNRIIYYTSAEPNPYQREIYSIKWDGTAKTKLSVDLGTNVAKFSEGFSYYTITFSNVKTPSSTILYNQKGERVRVLDDNKQLIDKLKPYRFNYKEFFDFNTSENINLIGWMLKPPDFDPLKKYPVLLTQYSGPNSQSALDIWNLGWEDYLAQMGYIIVCVDGRGTGSRGEAFRKATYLQLGKYETIDQIETAKYLGSLSYIDATRIGIWGWSFGGYISSSCMVKGNGIFKSAIAVAPVTNWRYYDNIYTERFMRTPQQNPDGYDHNSPLNFAPDFKGNFLICHGMADDNVHVQNTFEFTERLVQANKQFEMQLYTNRNHGIRGGNTTYHLYKKMTDFILEKL